MSTRGVILVAGALVGACGPHLVEHPVSKRTFMAGGDATCAQELARATFVARGAKWGESLRVEGCAVHGLGGYISVRADRTDVGPLAWDGSFGSSDDDSTRCRAGEPVAVVSGGPGGGAGGGAGGGGHGSASPASPAAAAPAVMREVMWDGNVCPNMMDTVMELGRLRPNSIIEVHVWSKLPRDMLGARLRITHSIDKPNVSDAEWEKHLAKEEADAEKRWREQERKRKKEGKPPPEYPPLTHHDDEPTGAPPPPMAEVRPPAPAATAEWVPGYWMWSRQWLWVAGRWQAPPAPGMVWQPGRWQRGPRAYIWITGAWVIR